MLRKDTDTSSTKAPGEVMKNDLVVDSRTEAQASWHSPHSLQPASWLSAVVTAAMAMGAVAAESPATASS